MDGLGFDAIAKKIAGRCNGADGGAFLGGKVSRRGLVRGGAAALAALGLGLGQAKNAAAQNSVNICNHTPDDIWVAVSYNENKGVWCTDNWWTEGWWQLRACGGCATVYSGEAASSYFYYHAYSSTSVWDGEFSAYVSDDIFETCEAQGSGLPGARPVGFREFNVGDSPRHTITLTTDVDSDGICFDFG